MEPHDIAREMGLSWKDFEELRAEFFRLEEETLRKKTDEEWFAEYVLLQQRNVNDLTKMLEELRDQRQPNAMVGAIKARADIYDRIVEKGQEFGFISKEPERKEIVGGVAVHNLSAVELREAITATAAATAALLMRYGGAREILPDAKIIDVTPGDLYQSAPKRKALPAVTVPPPTASKERQVSARKRHARNRVNKGRRVVRGA